MSEFEGDSSSPVKKNRSSQQRRGIYLTIAGAIGFIGLVLLMFIQGLSTPRVLTDSELKNNGVFLFERPRSLAEFALTDYNGRKFSAENFLGKWTLVFFGFTYCPDICPTTMALLNRFYEKQQGGDFGEDLQIVLVTVDPARDTPQKLLDYVKFFNPEFIGVSGEFLDLHRFATQLNIPFGKVPGGGENYTVEHSGNVAIINPQGHYVGFFRAPLDLSKLNLTYQSIRLTQE